MSDERTDRAMFERLQRIEVRMVRGFEELGVKVMDDEDWCTVDVAKQYVHLKGTGRSIRAVQLAIKAAGGYSGDYYTLITDGKFIGTLRGL